MEFEGEAGDFWFQELPKLLDEIEIKSIRAWTFLIAALLYCPLNFFLKKTPYQQLILLLINALKTDTIQLRPDRLMFLKALLKKPINFLYFFSL